MGKRTISESLKAIARNAAARMGENVVTMKDFQNHGITNATDSIFEKDVELTIPTLEELNATPGLMDFDTFTTNGRTSKAPYVWCPSSEGNKKMFLSQLTRNITPYKEENGTYVRDGEAVNSGTKLYQKLVGIRDAGTLLQTVAGMDIEVLDVKTGKQAAYTSGVISGLRDYNLPCFEEHKASTK
jgi:hypothetical protein